MIDVEDLLAILASECSAAQSAEAWARRHGLSGSYVRDVLNGKRQPGPSLLAALGYDRVVKYRKRAGRPLAPQ